MGYEPANFDFWHQARILTPAAPHVKQPTRQHGLFSVPLLTVATQNAALPGLLNGNACRDATPSEWRQLRR